MSKVGEKTLRLQRRPSSAIEIQLPDDVIADLERIAAEKDMTLEALVRAYLGAGLRDDLAKRGIPSLFSRRKSA
jgi:hypothetical protein